MAGLVAAKVSSRTVQPHALPLAVLRPSDGEGLGARTVSPSVETVLADLADRRTTAATTPAIAAAPPDLSREALQALARRCAPNTPTSVVLALIARESGGQPYTLSENRPLRLRLSPPSLGAARSELSDLLHGRGDVDVGLMQLNTATLRRLKVQPDEALNPCRNIELGAKVFDDAYAAAYGRRVPTVVLLSAFSTYNTGDPERGVVNGYAARATAALHTLTRSDTAD